jgi:hypothetical protein
MSSTKPHWYTYRTQRSHYTSQRLPFAESYEEWEPVYLQRLERGIVVLPQFEWNLISWPLDADERRHNALMGGVHFCAPAQMEEAAA